MNGQIAVRETLVLMAYATPLPSENSGSEAFFSIPQIELGLRNAGGWSMPILDGPGGSDMYGNLVAFASACGGADALRRINHLFAWLELHAGAVQVRNTPSWATCYNPMKPPATAI